MEALSFGSDLDGSSGTITITHDVHFVNNAISLRTINPPSPAFNGRIILIGGNEAISTQSGGNISRGGGVVIQQGASGIFIYNSATGLWYPVL